MKLEVTLNRVQKYRRFQPNPWRVELLERAIPTLEATTVPAEPVRRAAHVDVVFQAHTAGTGR